MTGELLDGRFEALAQRALLGFGDGADGVPLLLHGLQPGPRPRQLFVVDGGQRFDFRAQLQPARQIGLSLGVSGVLFELTAREHRVAGGAKFLPQRLLLSGRSLHGRMPFGLGVLGGFYGGAQVRAFDHRLDAVNQLLAALYLAIPLGAEARVQMLHDLLKAAIQVFAIRPVDRSEFEPLLLGATTQPVGLPPIHFLPVGGGFELFQLIAERPFLFKILLAFAVLRLEIGLARRIGALARLVEALPQRPGRGALVVVQGFPGFAGLLDALGDFGGIGFQADQALGSDAELLTGLVSAPAPPVPQLADTAGAMLQALLDHRHLRPAQADVVLQLMASLLLQMSGLLEFTFFECPFEPPYRLLDLLPFLIPLLDLPLQAGTQLVERAVELALEVAGQLARFGALQPLPALPQVLQIDVAHFAGLFQQGFRLSQHVAQMFGANVIAMDDAFLFANVVTQLLEARLQSPALGILGRTELTPGGRRIVDGVVDGR